ncbi:hypothetical protein ZHAS_00018758 [Anopheles sinensis]|uniref:Uncharacterized protein n=1 Tax=Anopheles sinensis TaxID=74873 RepID=A0A084WKH3_ANOSI|nr:hypothetical protein ZHAS_00018758 [Anopheles sinensis]
MNVRCLLVLSVVCLVQLTVGSNRSTASTVAFGKAPSPLVPPKRPREMDSSGRTRVHLAGGFIGDRSNDDEDDTALIAPRAASSDRQRKEHRGELSAPGRRSRQREEAPRKLASVRGTSGPVHTYIKTDKNANFKWGVRHFVGKKYAR